MRNCNWSIDMSLTKLNHHKFSFVRSDSRPCQVFDLRTLLFGALSLGLWFSMGATLISYRNLLIIRNLPWSILWIRKFDWLHFCLHCLFGDWQCTHACCDIQDWNPFSVIHMYFMCDRTVRNSAKMIRLVYFLWVIVPLTILVSEWLSSLCSYKLWEKLVIHVLDTCI